MQLASDITAEDLQAFLAEADEQLQLLDEDIVRLEKEHDNEDLLQEIFRAAHTLKGSSAMLGHNRMAGVAHVMETLLDMVRKGTLEITTQVADALLHGLDVLNQLKGELIEDNAPETDISEVVAELERAAENEGVVSGQDSGLADDDLPKTVDLGAAITERFGLIQESGRDIYQVKIVLRDGTSWAAVRCYQAIESLKDMGELLGSNPTEEDVAAEKVSLIILAVLATDQDEESVSSMLKDIEEVEVVEVGPYVIEATELIAEAEVVVSGEDEVATEDSATRQPKGGQAQTVRVDVERLDHILNMIGELIIDRTRIVQISRSLDSQYGEDDLVQALSKTSAHIVRVVDELQESTMKVRMLPIGTVFSGFPRMMRDLAQKVDKKVDFEVDGQDTEIDRTVVDRIRDPLLHLLRNSLDHGIESPEERVAMGKPEAGTIRLSAYHEQGHIVIKVEDDGKGIDPQRLRDSVVSKGLLSAEAASRLTDAESLDLIFIPGASTAAQTTDISGRGVGMDIVRSNIEAINGFLTVDTKVGEGTTFTLRLPLTLATLQALLVSLDHTLYAVPLVYVLEAVVKNQAEISTVEGKEVIRLRGNVVPLIRLSEVLGVDSDGTADVFDTDDGENTTDDADAKQAWVVIVRFGERLVGLAVDELTELQEIVVKSLGRYIGDVKGIAGASVLGDGRVVLILDVASLMNLVMQGTRIPGVGDPRSEQGELQPVG